MDKLEIKQGSFIQQTQTKDGLRMSDKMDVLKWQLKKKFTGTPGSHSIDWCFCLIGKGASQKFNRIVCNSNVGVY
jgi:hypothetical protein